MSRLRAKGHLLPSRRIWLALAKVLAASDLYLDNAVASQCCLAVPTNVHSLKGADQGPGVHGSQAHVQAGSLLL